MQHTQRYRYMLVAACLINAIVVLFLLNSQNLCIQHFSQQPHMTREFVSDINIVNKYNTHENSFVWRNYHRDSHNRQNIQRHNAHSSFFHVFEANHQEIQITHIISTHQPRTPVQWCKLRREKQTLMANIESNIDFCKNKKLWNLHSTCNLIRNNQSILKSSRLKIQYIVIFDNHTSKPKWLHCFRSFAIETENHHFPFTGLKVHTDIPHVQHFQTKHC